MIIDVTGIILTPGNNGNHCPGNGQFYENGEQLECCCDECDYMMCCLPNHNPKECEICNDKQCPHSKFNR